MVERKQGQLQSTPAYRASSSSSKSSEAWHEMERINVQGIKDNIVKLVGAEKSKRYFSHFRRFLSAGLSKTELDKLVVKTIGKENVRLHNQLVRAILSNAVKATKFPPLPSEAAQHAPTKPPLIPYSPCVTSDEATTYHASPSTLSNGDSVLSSPRRGRTKSTVRDHKSSHLGPREDNLRPWTDRAGARIDHQPTPDLSRPTSQCFDGATKLPDSESNSSAEPPLKRARVVVRPSSDETVGAVESFPLSGEDSRFRKEEEREEIVPSFPIGSSIKAPLGVPLCFHRSHTNEHRKPLPQALPARFLQEASEADFLEAIELPDGNTMHMFMEEIASTEGLQYVSRDAADILNLALDVYLKRLIKPCMNAKDSQGLAKTAPSSNKSASEGILPGNKIHRSINGVWSRQSGSEHDKVKMGHVISLKDFKSALDLNPQPLGGDWPLQLEKISLRMPYQ
jgi:hypothetical protein